MRRKERGKWKVEEMRKGNREPQKGETGIGKRSAAKGEKGRGKGKGGDAKRNRVK